MQADSYKKQLAPFDRGMPLSRTKLNATLTYPQKLLSLLLCCLITFWTTPASGNPPSFENCCCVPTTLLSSRTVIRRILNRLASRKTLKPKTQCTLKSSTSASLKSRDIQSYRALQIQECFIIPKHWLAEDPMYPKEQYTPPLRAEFANASIRRIPKPFRRFPKTLKPNTPCR